MLLRHSPLPMRLIVMCSASPLKRMTYRTSLCNTRNLSYSPVTCATRLRTGRYVKAHRTFSSDAQVSGAGFRGERRFATVVNSNMRLCFPADIHMRDRPLGNRLRLSTGALRTLEDQAWTRAAEALSSFGIFGRAATSPLTDENANPPIPTLGYATALSQGNRALASRGLGSIEMRQLQQQMLDAHGETGDKACD